MNHRSTEPHYWETGMGRGFKYDAMGPVLPLSVMDVTPF